MNVQQILPKTKVASAAPVMELLENDQVLPAGMWRWRIQGDTALLERATAVDWTTVTTALSISSAGVVTPLGTALADDQVLSFGGVVSMLWETADADANAFIISLPEGGATDVPVLVLGDASILNADLGWFNGVTEPRFAVVDDDKDSYVALGFSADDAAAIIIGGSAALTLPALTLGGAVAGGDQVFTNVGDLTFAAGSIIASGGTNGNTLLLRANDATFITLTTGATDVCTIDGVTATGTWLVSGTWTLPAITLGGVVTVADDIAASFGGVASLLWETQDADANALLITLPTGGAVDVPVIVIGQGVTGVDLGLYNGVVDPRIAIFGIGAVTTGPVWEFRKARGTIAAPTIITSGDDLGSLNFYGYSGSTGYHLSAAIEVDSTGTIGPTGTVRVPSVIRFRTSTDAAPSVLTTWLTIGAAGGLAMPNLKIVEDSTTTFGFRKVSDSSLANLQVAILTMDTSVDSQADGVAINTWQSDGAYMTLKARDSGVGQVEVLRWSGAADPYVRIGRDDTGVALDAVTDMLVLQAGGGTGNEAANFGFGLSIKLGNAASEVEKRAALEWILIDATNGSEDVQLEIKLMAAGAAPARALQLSGVVSAFGMSALISDTGSNNNAFGIESLYTNTTGGYNCAFGNQALYTNNGTANCAFGVDTLALCTTGGYNAAFGFSALYSNSTGSANVALGNAAGYYETGSNKLFIDNAERADEADGRLKALLYGIFAAATTNQYLTVNANLICSVDLAFTSSIDSAAVVDEVSLGAYEISADHRALAISSEEVVVAAIGVASTEKYPVRINGVTKNIMLCA